MEIDSNIVGAAASVVGAVVSVAAVFVTISWSKKGIYQASAMQTYSDFRAFVAKRVQCKRINIARAELQQLSKRIQAIEDELRQHLRILDKDIGKDPIEPDYQRRERVEDLINELSFRFFQLHDARATPSKGWSKRHGLPRIDFGELFTRQSDVVKWPMLGLEAEEKIFGSSEFAEWKARMNAKEASKFMCRLGEVKNGENWSTQLMWRVEQVFHEYRAIVDKIDEELDPVVDVWRSYAAADLRVHPKINFADDLNVLLDVVSHKPYSGRVVADNFYFHEYEEHPFMFMLNIILQLRALARNAHITLSTLGRLDRSI